MCYANDDGDKHFLHNKHILAGQSKIWDKSYFIDSVKAKM